MSKEIKTFEGTGNSEIDDILKEAGLSLGDDSKRLLDKKREERAAEQQVNIMGLVDATGSMTSVWNETKKIIKELLQNMSQYGDIEMKWVAYRDYDAGNKILEWSPWTNNVQRLISFFNQIECRWGDDWEEAVEVALRHAREDKRKKTVFLIGDASPHAEKDWQMQAELLARENTKVYSFVVKSYDEMVDDTYRTFSKISKITGGACCILNGVQDILAVLSLIISKQVSEESFQITLKELKKKSGGKLPPHLDDFSNQLRLGE
jgi:hypothetical protein